MILRAGTPMDSMSASAWNSMSSWGVISWNTARPMSMMPTAIPMLRRTVSMIRFLLRAP